MRKQRGLFWLVVFLAFGVLGLVTAKEVKAQVVSLSPATATKTVNETFTVDVNIDTKGKAVSGADVKLTFDPAALEISQITAGDFFSEKADNLNAATGTIYIVGYFREAYGSKTGTGKVASLTLKGKKAGAAQLTFVCTPQPNDVDIYDKDANDIAECSLIGNGVYNITEGGSQPAATATPAPGSSGGTTATTAPAAATAMPAPPVSGVALPTILSLGLGMLLTIVGFAIIF